MAESLHLAEEGAGKKERYEILLPQLEHLTEDETDLIANLANIVAVLKEAFGFFWIGVYFVRAEELVLGPFQGPLACTRIAYGKGVCGTAWTDGRTIVVDDVDEFPGHIACSSLSKSEIVVPVFVNDAVKMVLDVDSEVVKAFDEVDALYLGKVAKLMGRLMSNTINA
jgi:GAF domain-containing protein